PEADEDDGPPTYAIAGPDDAPLDETDPESLFREMAARQDRAAARAPARVGPPRRRRRRLRLPEWFVPLITGGAALIAVAYVLAFFYSYLVQQRVLRPELTAVEEQRRLVEGQRLADALARLRTTPDDADARRDLDAWLDG